jgi:GT2 family glycosyltransferase
MGIKEAKGDLFFFIDDDNVVTGTTILSLVRAFKREEKAGIISPVAFYYDRRDRVLDAGAARNYHNSFTVNLFLNRKRGEIPEGALEVSEVSNAFMVAAEVIRKIGIFDEANFPIDLDEADLCIRAKKAGFKIYSLFGADIFHRVEKINTLSFSSLRFRRVENAYNMGRNRIIFQRKHSNSISYIVYLLLYFPLFFHLYLLSQLLPQPGYNAKQRISFIAGFIEGVRDGLFCGPKIIKGGDYA